MLLVDANIVAYLLIDGTKTAQARALWMIDSDWRAPRLLFYELANVFARYVKQGAVSLETAVAGLGRVAGLIHLLDQDPGADRVLTIASKLALSAYDAIYLATAKALGTPLVTEDSRLLRVAPGVTRSLESLTGSG